MKNEEIKRVIKFRAWDEDAAKWVDPSFIMIHGCGTITIYDEFEDKYNEIDESIKLVQYTGLKDKNGKEIYEGDILQRPDAKFIVYWDDDIKQLWCRPIDIPKNKIQSAPRSVYVASFDMNGEVIGNIYENSELLG